MSLSHPAALVVDDDPIVRDLIRAVLEDAGWKVTEAGSGDEALALHQPGIHDLVVLDCRMPGRDGPSTFASLRGPEPELPVLFVSGHPTPALEAILNTHRGCRLLRKPFAPEDLLSTIGALRASARSMA